MKRKKDYVMINGKKEYFTPLELIDPYPTLSKRDVVKDFFLVEKDGEPYITIDETKLFINSIYKDIEPSNGYFINENGKPYILRKNVILLGAFVDSSKENDDKS